MKTYLTKNIQISEVKCRCGKCDIPTASLENLKAIAEVVQYIRDYYDRPVIINSGYRCPAHNKAVGGALRSQHQYGRAIDFNVKGVSPRLVRELLEDLLEKGDIYFEGLGSYQSFTHIDLGRGFNARW